MLLKLKWIKNKDLRRFSEHSLYIALVFLFVPGLIFELCIVLPGLIEKWSLLYYGHLGISSFLLYNCVGNMYNGMFINNGIKGKNLEGFNKEEWTFCSACQCLRPPRAWHCEICEVCILHRDHHCRYLANCVGYFNRRYFMMCTLYAFIGLMVAFVHNIIFLSPLISWNQGLLLIKISCPPLGIIFDYGVDSLCVLFLVMNAIAVILSGILFVYHLINILKGRLYAEKKTYTKDFIHNKGLKLNVIEVFGSRWYLTWISPFIDSELPGNGIESPVKSKSKISQEDK